MTGFVKIAQMAQEMKSNLQLIKTTLQTHQMYLGPSLLSQIAFYQLCQAMKVHYRACGASEQCL